MSSIKELLHNLKETWKYTKGVRKYILIITIISICYIATSVIVPIFSAKQIIELTNNQLEQLLYISGVLLGLELFRGIMHYLRRICTQIVHRRSFVKIQSELGKEILKLENKTIDNNSSGVFIQRLTEDCENMSRIFNDINRDLMRVFADIGVFSAIFIINKTVFAYVALTTILLYFIENKRTKTLQNNYSKYKIEREKLSGFVGELVRGIRDIKMLNAEKSFMNELDKKVEVTNTKGYITKNVDNRYNFLRDIIVDFTDFGLIVVLVRLLSLNVLQVASALILYNYSDRVRSIINFTGTLLETVRDYNLSCKRVFSIINSEDNFVKETFGTQEIEKIVGNFEFKNVRFSYEDGMEVLKGINFKINSKETVAFVGKSGAGKTTIFNLICKMYEINDGQILIDGKDINQLSKDAIRGNVTIISQNPYIFNMTIKENLKLVKSDITDEEIKKACNIACLSEFIEELPDKYDSIIGEGGVNLSGGQKQRLAIARALIQDTRIILFDEATSALDNETQAKIQEAINNLREDYTILIIAHRLSTVINADKILFLNDGVIEAEGKHEELLEKSKHYHDLYQAELRI